ncbi:MAG: N-acetylmuramoyl-L-alanine amidase [Proteobacteria bacterium]|nr:N-acetylmuramoyl-L-alanine amidase [Pseudomonadota bacterium]
MTQTHTLPSHRSSLHVGGTPRYLVVLLAALVLLFALDGQARATDQQPLYAAALESFKQLQSSDQRASRRDLWIEVHARFERTFKISPTSGYAPKCLYYMGRCYEELALRSGGRSDAFRAVDYFQRATTRFPPGNSWIDDCLYRKAEITFVRLGETRTAAEDLRIILRLYPKGDHASKAAKLLARIEGRSTAGASVVTKSRAEKAASPEPANRSSSATPSGIKAAYAKALEAFKALRAKKNPTRDEFLRVVRRFAALEEAAGRDVTAARSAYFQGFTWDELGRISRRDDDYMKAVAGYERAVELFKDSDSWRDDALFRKGYVEYMHLSDEDQAYADLLLVVRDYPDGDQAAEAKDLLRAMDEARANELPDAADAVAQDAANASTALALSSIPPVAPEIMPSGAGTSSFNGKTGEATLLGVRYSSGDDFTRVVLDLDNAVEFKENSLPGNDANGKLHRMFVDLQKTRVAKTVQTRQELPGGFLKSVRTGQYTPDTARVVLDFTEKQEYHILTLENPYRIVIDVFARKAVVEETPGKLDGFSAATPTPGKKERQTAKDVLAQLGMTIGTVMIDAGHGGRDPGAVQYVHYKDDKGKLHKKLRTMEKDVTLQLAMILGDALKRKGYTVLYTRDQDRKVALEDRVLAANIKKADLFISLHCNANNKSSVRGFETYYLGKAKNDLVLKLAAKENNVDPMKISDTQKIVLDLVHSFKIEESKVLASHVQKNSVRGLRSKYRDINDHGARAAPFFVLIGARMPAVLVEVGYISNSTEAKLLRSEGYLQEVSKGIVAGVEAYRKELQTAGL